MELDDLTNRLRRSADLVKGWGKTVLPNGKTLGEMLTFDSIPFWDVVAAEIALYHVPKALSRSDDRLQRVIRSARTYLRAVEYLAVNGRNRFLAGNRPPARSSEPVFLFLGFQPYIYRDTLQPIVRHMAGDEAIRCISLCEDLSSLRPYRSSDKEQFQSIWQHWNGDVKACANGLTNSLKNAVKELHDMGTLPRIMQDGRGSLWPRMKGVFDWLFFVYLPNFMKHYAISRHILDKYRPEIIFSPDVADPRTRVYCLAGRQRKIPTLEIQFGVYGQEAVEWQFFIADRIAAWGERSRDTLLSHGVDAGKIFLTGAPRHDGMVSVDEAEVSGTRSALGIPGGPAMVLFASTYASVYDQQDDPTLVDSVKRAVIRSAGSNGELRLVFKPHPLEDVRAAKKIAEGYRNILFAERDDDIRRLIRACDVFISLGTTATLDAIIANKLTICPKLPGWGWSDLFVDSGAVLAPASLEELQRCLKTAVPTRRKVLEDLEPARQRFLKEWIFKADGQASSRIASLAREMVLENRDGPE
ncbi:MAG: CDP-glycerol glycerophosphotransferase family protein [Deltaproteobacteria bacterium]|nr:CDP-glycerol glycerophosphotransferase family protein [Deltaproteobacteria bacterium]